MNEEYNNENEITLADICAVLFGRWKLFLIVLCSILVLGIGGVFLLDKLTEDYEAIFTYSVKELNDSENAKYYNGNKFDYNTLLSKESLEYYQQSEILSNLDLSDLFSKNAIKIESYAEYQEDKTSNDTNKPSIISYQGYKLTLDKSSFKKEEAKELATLVAKEAKRIALSYNANAKLAGTYSTYLDSSDKSIAFETKIDFLKKQYDELTREKIVVNDSNKENIISINLYDALIDYYGDINLSDGTRVSDHLIKAKTFFKDKTLDDLSYELSLKGYTNNSNSLSDYEQTLKNRYSNYEDQVKLNEAKIDSLKLLIDHYAQFGVTGSEVQSFDFLPYNTELVRLTGLVEDYKYEMRSIEKLLHQTYNSSTKEWSDDLLNPAPTQDENIAFANLIKSFRNDVEDLVNEYIDVEKEVIEKQTNYYFKVNKIVETENSKFEAKTLYIIVVVCAIFLPMIVNLAVDGKKIFKTNVVNKENK